MKISEELEILQISRGWGAQFDLKKKFEGFISINKKYILLKMIKLLTATVYTYTGTPSFLLDKNM